MLKTGKICLQQQLVMLLPFLKISWIVPRRKVDRYSILRFLFARQSVNLAIFHGALVNVSDRGENSFSGEWPKRANEQARVHKADGFFFLGKLPRIAKTTNKRIFNKQTKFYTEKYNGSLRRISIVINARRLFSGNIHRNVKKRFIRDTWCYA